MTESLFINIHGQPIDTGAAGSRPKRKAPLVAKLTGVDYLDELSLGFVVEGFTQKMLDDARADRAFDIGNYPTACAEAEEMHKPIPRRPLPWDEDAWFNTAKPAKVRARPYEIRSAADECAALAARGGVAAGHGHRAEQTAQGLI